LLSPHNRKAPFALVHHRSALVAVALSAFLVALAAASAPFVTTATASAALKNKLVDLAPLTTGLQISSRLEALPTERELDRAAKQRVRAAQTLSDGLHLERPVFTVEATTPLAVLNGNGDERLRLMARSGALRHVKILSRTKGDGVWISDLTARTTGLELGGTLRLQYSGLGQPPAQHYGVRGSATRTVGVRVKGIYRALDRSAPDAYWANFLEEILPPGVDPPPPQRYVFMSFRDLYRITPALSAVRKFRQGGRTFRVGFGPQLTTVNELAVAQDGLTLARARTLTRHFDLLQHTLARSELGSELGCALPGRTTTTGWPRLMCSMSSSLSAAVKLADANADAISPVVSLLSGAGIGITLAVAGAAGVFLVRRRRAEAALLFARGEHVAAFAARSLVEMLVPTLLGAGAGFAVALGLTGLFAPAGSIDAHTLGAAATHAAMAACVGLVLASAAAGVVFLHLFDTGTLQRRWLRWLPWELPLLALGGWLLHDVLTGGGIARSATGSGGHPTLAVFVLPLVLVAAVAGLATRVVRLILQTRPERGAELPTPLFLALRRASAARGLLTALLVVAAVCFGAYFYAEALAASVKRSVDEKAAIAYGGDAQGIVSDTQSLPRRFPYPLTRVAFANQAATIGDAAGATADVMAVDPATLRSVMYWYSDWGADPRPRLDELATPRGPLPAIVTSSVPPETKAIWLEGVRLPIRVVSRVSSFPGMSGGVPLVVVAGGSLDAAARRAHVLNPLGVTQTYVWAKGTPKDVVRALEVPPIQASFVTSGDEFRHDPDVLLATRTLTYLRLIAAAAGALVFVGLLLYLQARQRSQAAASALAARMGLRRGAETLSLAVELASIASFAAVLGGLVALLTAIPIVGHVDPLPDNPPVPPPVIPVAAIVLAAVGLLLVAFVAGAITSWLSRRSDASEALRVA
jgi:putative ABC transport system permease protein